MLGFFLICLFKVAVMKRGEGFQLYSRTYSANKNLVTQESFLSYVFPSTIVFAICKYAISVPPGEDAACGSPHCSWQTAIISQS